MIPLLRNCWNERKCDHQVKRPSVVDGNKFGTYRNNDCYIAISWDQYRVKEENRKNRDDNRDDVETVRRKRTERGSVKVIGEKKDDHNRPRKSGRTL